MPVRALPVKIPSGLAAMRSFRGATQKPGPSAGIGSPTPDDEEDAPAAGATPVLRAPPVPSAQMAERSARMGRVGTPNQGGSISAGGVTRAYAPSPAANIDPGRPNLGGTMSTTPAPVSSPTTSNAQQTESANPLTGDGNAQPGGTTDQVNPGSALGISRRGSSVPSGTDALADSSTIGGSGIYARKFSSPKSANLYGDFVKKLFSA